MPRNRLAGMHVPPGGTSVLAQFWVFVVELLGGGWHSARWNEGSLARFWYTAWRLLASRQAMAWADPIGGCVAVGFVEGRKKVLRVVARVSAPGGRNCRKGPCTAWRLVARYAPPGGPMKHNDAMLGSGDAVPLAGSSPFLFVYGDDRVIRYTGADVDTGGAEDVQATE
ncbi:hypothetical protein DEO72_LG2g2102 [Vigna unguiculata]|uniref:Uncharacterized protein n=1 Tax=Vigna unguiculata TaxID=3917 RepID=A0A4D6KWB9_VIGUN|nr:hypothetical protein DEO72_LG2g2102 [Vigna unguiculata]